MMELNRLSLRIVSAELEDGRSYQAAQITIDESSLIDLARRKEEPFAKREGHPKLAGAYSWLPRTQAARMLNPDVESSSEKVALLECTCGIPGCWPLLAKVSKTEAQVVWSDFEQPHRHEAAVAGHWNYEAFGPFAFDRELYEDELRAIV